MKILHDLLSGKMNVRKALVWIFLVVMAGSIASGTVAIAVQVIKQAPELVASLAK